MQNLNMNLVLSTDAKPRLKWTTDLHQRFVEGVTLLGGPEKATPKSLMRAMGIPGLTLYHLKSHLQKYRLGKSQLSETFSDDNKQEDLQGSEGHSNKEFNDGSSSQSQMNESLKIAEALQLQMEVQRKLHEQIEVQRRLQMRIEAQGKYLQSVLKKAQETLAGYSSSSLGLESAKTELSRLLSMVNSGSPLSGVTEAEMTGPDRKRAICSMDSSLTSSESSGRREEPRKKKAENAIGVELTLMEVCPENRARKRSGSTVSDGVCVEQPVCKRSSTSSGHLREPGMAGTMDIDLNSKYESDIDSGPKALDLNCTGI